MNIKAVLIKDLNVVMFTTPYNKLWCGDSLLPVNTKVTLQAELIDQLHERSTIRQIIGYGVDDFLNPDEYAQKILEITGGNDYSDLDLDGRYHFDKFTQNHQPVYSEDTIKKVPATLEIIKVQLDTGSPFITEVWTIAETPQENRLYVLDTMMAVKSEFVKQCKEMNLKYELPDHSGLRYAKVEGQYVFSEVWDIKTKFHGSLEMCKDFLAGKIDSLITILKLSKAKKENILMPAGDWPEILNSLYKVQSFLQDVSPMKASQESMKRSYTALNETIKLLKSKVINASK